MHRAVFGEAMQLPKPLSFFTKYDRRIRIIQSTLTLIKQKAHKFIGFEMHGEREGARKRERETRANILQKVPCTMKFNKGF